MCNSLQTGLVDEVSVMIGQCIYGRKGMVAVFDGVEDISRHATFLCLGIADRVNDSTVWLRHSVPKLADEIGVLKQAKCSENRESDGVFLMWRVGLGFLLHARHRHIAIYGWQVNQARSFANIMVGLGHNLLYTVNFQVA